MGVGPSSPLSQQANPAVHSAVTGLMFARFARPTARVLFSNVLVVRPQGKNPILSFRLANQRTNQIVEATVRFAVMRTKTLEDGEKFRLITDLGLVRNNSPVFTNSWTVAHVLDETSPLFGCTPESLEKEEADFLVSLTGIDNTFAQTVHARRMYKPRDIRWNHRFVDIFVWKTNGEFWVDLSKIHSTQGVK